MQYYVTKNNIPLTEKPFDTLEEAAAFGKDFLERVENPNQYNEPSLLGYPQKLHTVKIKTLKGYYKHSYRVYLTCVYSYCEEKRTHKSYVTIWEDTTFHIIQKRS